MGIEWSVVFTWYAIALILSVLAERLAIVNRNVIANIINGLMWYFAVVLRTLNGGR
jgi:hypothetical protein